MAMTCAIVYLCESSRNTVFYDASEAFELGTCPRASINTRLIRKLNVNWVAGVLLYNCVYRC